MTAPLFFHFDVAEPVKKHANLVVLPTWSSILYLSDCGGSTVILENVLRTENHEFNSSAHNMKPENFSDAMLVSPRKNQFLIFPGNKLHGVLPVNTQSNEVLESPKGHDVVTVTGRKGKNSIINGVYKWNASQQRFIRPYNNMNNNGEVTDNASQVMLWETPNMWMIGDEANYNTTIGYAMLKKQGWSVVGASNDFERDPLVTMERGDLQHLHFCKRTTILMNWWQHTVLMTDFNDSRIELQTHVALEDAQHHHPVTVEPLPILLREDVELEIRLPGEKMKRCAVLPLPAESTPFSKVHWQQSQLSYNCSTGSAGRGVPQVCPVCPVCPACAACAASSSSKSEGSELMALRLHLEERLNTFAQRELNASGCNGHQVALDAQLAVVYRQFEAQLTLAKDNEISRLMAANTQNSICAGVVILIMFLVQLHTMHHCTGRAENKKKVL